MTWSHVRAVPAARSASALGLIAVLGICGAFLTACSSSSPPQANSARARITTAHKHQDYLAARREWLDEGQVWSSADQGRPLELAVTDLKHGEVTDAGNKSDYPATIAALDTLLELPDAMDTRAQDAQARAAVAQVDRFFHVRVTRGCNWPSPLKACWLTR